jgi:glycosyltransferase involved in cell wall biosynthesis
MKILLINKFFHRRGGAEVVFLNTAVLLRRAGHTVVEFSTKHPENENSPCADTFVESADFPTLQGVRPMMREAVRAIYSREAYRKLLELVRREKPDIAHVHNYYFHLTPSILYALRDAGVPVVHTLHDYHLACPNHGFYDYRRNVVCEDCPRYGFHRVLVRGCMRVGRVRSLVAYLEAILYRALGTYRRLVQHYIAPSEFLRSKLSPRPVPPDRISVLPNTVEDVGGLGPVPGDGAFFYAGRLSREKGLDLLLEVARRLPKTRWRLAGSGPLENELRRAMESEGLSTVTLLGHLKGEALREEYRRALAVVLPSRCYENCPLTVLEAMSAGRPAIGARIGGIAELVREGETGWLFAPGSADDLERIVGKAPAQPDVLVRIEASARRAFIERYAPAIHLERLLAIYEKAITARPMAATKVPGKEQKQF